MEPKYTKGQLRILKQASSIMEAAFREYDIVLSSPEQTRKYLQTKLIHNEHEVFAALWLDNRHHVIQFDELFRGTIDGAAVYPREVVKAAIQHNAAAVIFAHNHPSGNPDPSQADITLTRRLKEALDLIDVRVLDHMVIGDSVDGVVSMAERGLL